MELVNEEDSSICLECEGCKDICKSKNEADLHREFHRTMEQLGKDKDLGLKSCKFKRVEVK